MSTSPDTAERIDAAIAIADASMAVSRRVFSGLEAEMADIVHEADIASPLTAAGDIPDDELCPPGVVRGPHAFGDRSAFPWTATCACPARKFGVPQATEAEAIADIPRHRPVAS